MTQLSIFDSCDLTTLRFRLRSFTRPGSKARSLGEWWLSLGRPVTLGEIQDWGRANYCSSVMERVRCDLRGRCNWPIVCKGDRYIIDGLHNREAA